MSTFDFSDINGLLKQAQDLKENLSKQQEDIEKQTFEGTAGGDMVVVTVSGKFEIKKIQIAPDIIDPKDPEMLSDLILSATNAAITKARNSVQNSLGGLAGNIDLSSILNRK